VPLWKRHGVDPGLEAGSVSRQLRPGLEAEALVDEKDFATNLVCFQ
jgi:hypothetical protein